LLSLLTFLSIWTEKELIIGFYLGLSLELSVVNETLFVISVRASICTIGLSLPLIYNYAKHKSPTLLLSLNSVPLTGRNLVE